MRKSCPTAYAEELISNFSHNVLVLVAGFVDMMISVSYMGSYIPWLLLGLVFSINNRINLCECINKYSIYE